WWPGVQIHHSRDLPHWRLLSRPLSRLFPSAGSAGEFLQFSDFPSYGFLPPLRRADACPGQVLRDALSFAPGYDQKFYLTKEKVFGKWIVHRPLAISAPCSP